MWTWSGGPNHVKYCVQFYFSVSHFRGSSYALWLQLCLNLHIRKRIFYWLFFRSLFRIFYRNFLSFVRSAQLFVVIPTESVNYDKSRGRQGPHITMCCMMKSGFQQMISRSLYNRCHTFTGEAPLQFLLLHLSAMLIYLAATQMSQFMKFEEHSETSSSHGGTGLTSAGALPVPQLPRLQENVCNSMFFC